MRLFLALALACALSGPALAAGVAYIPDQTSTPSAQSQPASGIPLQVEIGGLILSTETGGEVPAIMLRQPVSAASELTSITIPAGKMYKRGRGEGGVFYQTGALASVTFQGAAREFPKAGLFVPADKTRPVLAYWHMADQPNAITIPVAGADFAPTPNFEEDGFRMDLVYAGVSKGVVSVQYREFKDGYARPAFGQQLTYDLAEGKEIGFRGARIRVIKATNTSLQYVVLKPFGTP